MGERAYSALVEACKRRGRPELAAWYVHEDMPAAGVEPDTAIWNALLGAYGRNGHIDGAYATWQVRPWCPNAVVRSGATGTGCQAAGVCRRWCDAA